MLKGQNEVDKFFEGLPSEEKMEKPFEEDQAPPAKEDKGEPDPEKGEARRDNRQTRRLKTQLQQERDARIAAEARAEGKADAERQRPPPASDDVPSDWLRIYGDTPETRTAWQLNKGMFQNLADKAKADAVEEFKREQQDAAKKVKEFESVIDAELEAIEDEHDVDVTSDAPAARKARREFLEHVEKLSPKNKDGEVIAFADFGAAWETFAGSKKEPKPDTDKNKELAARGLQRSSSDAPAAKEPTPGFFGWQKDMGAN